MCKYSISLSALLISKSQQLKVDVCTISFRNDNSVPDFSYHDGHFSFRRFHRFRSSCHRSWNVDPLISLINSPIETASSHLETFASPPRRYNPRAFLRPFSPQSTTPRFKTHVMSSVLKLMPNGSRQAPSFPSLRLIFCPSIQAPRKVACSSMFSCLRILGGASAETRPVWAWIHGGEFDTEGDRVYDLITCSKRLRSLEVAPVSIDNRIELLVNFYLFS